MYTGTLIDDLMDTVERVEKFPQVQNSQREELDFWYAQQNENTRFETSLAGVA